MLSGIRYTKHMQYMLRAVLPVLLLAGVALPEQAAAGGLSFERGGLGLRQPGTAADPTAIRILRGDYALPAAAREDTATTTFSGLRERTRLGLTAPETFGGLAHAFSDRLTGSLELATMESTALASRRYSLAGQLQTALDASSGMSIGVTYRVYEPDYGMRAGAAPEVGAANGYSLVPVRAPGTGLGPSYQLQLHYQYSLTTTFGLVLGRELETFTSGFDATGTGLRQFSFTGQHWLTPSWALSYDVLSSDPGSFRLQGLRLGVRYRF